MIIRTLALLAAVLAIAPPTAHADDSLENWLIGPVLGVRLSGPPGDRAVLGFEGGVGYGPERINIGFEHRDSTDFGYVELDPWYFLGGTLGVGVDSDGKVQPVLGVWEGLPLDHTGGCSGWHRQVTIAGGYRFTGVHELYVTVKAGSMQGNVCFD